MSGGTETAFHEVYVSYLNKSETIIATQDIKTGTPLVASYHPDTANMNLVLCCCLPMRHISKGMQSAEPKPPFVTY